VMGVRMPWREVISPSAAPTGAAIRVLTCNAHRNMLDTAEFASLIASTRPDVVAMQEWTSAHLAAFPKTDNWNVIRDDELCLFSRYPIRKLADIGAENWKPQGISGAAAIYELSTPNGPVPFFNLHLASPHRQFDAALHRAPDAGAQVEKNSGVRLRQSQLLAQIAAKLGPATLLSGDFNTPVESDIFGKSWRAFPDAFETAGWGLGHTYFARWTTVRIDHVLSGSNWRCRRCWVAPHVGSPHRPVIAEFEWVGPP
jgi:vancomycin resistance protein VanJ